MVNCKRRELVFLGVSTGKSTIQRLFAPWAECLGQDMVLSTRDLPLRSPVERYREFVRDVKGSGSGICGALITSHKAALYDAASEMFDRISPASRRLGEIGMVYWDGDVLVGDANDAISTKEVCQAMLLPSRAWREGSRQAVVLGGGGAGLALANTLAMDEALGCKHIVITETDDDRRVSIQKRIRGWDSDVPIDVSLAKGPSDQLVATVGTGGLIANATGLGKDRPGSPITEKARFGKHLHVWEFNYRFVEQSTPTFLDVARSQESLQGLLVFDGWEYFVWGWLVVMATAMGLTPSTYYREFQEIADRMRNERQ